MLAADATMPAPETQPGEPHSAPLHCRGMVRGTHLDGELQDCGAIRFPAEAGGWAGRGSSLPGQSAQEPC